MTDAANLIPFLQYPCRLMLPPVITACQAIYSKKSGDHS